MKKRAAGRKARQYSLELLEPRHLLSANSPLDAGLMSYGAAVELPSTNNSAFHDSLEACTFTLPNTLTSGSSTASGALIETTPFPQDQTFLLHSLPGATKVIYMDFTGHQTVGTSWNTSYDTPNILTPAYDVDGDPTNFNAEWGIIQSAWEHLSELFRPFNVDVTTQDPGVDGLRDTGNGDETWGIRVAIGGSVFDWFAPNGGWDMAAGVAGSPFHNSADVPCFAFAAQIGANADGIALVAAHEVGHTLGLGHDGQNRSFLNLATGNFVNVHSDYFGGFAQTDDSNLMPLPGDPPFDPPIPPSDGNIYWSPLTTWGPIMGSGGSSLMQWSKGEYFGSDNIQDDLAIISSAQNGFGYRPDDHLDAITGSTPLTADPETANTDTVTIEGEGIIGQHPAPGVSDADFFTFIVDGLGEVVELNIDPFINGRNLDILAKIYNATGTLIATSNPLTELAAGSATFFSTYYSASNEGEAIPDGGWQVQLDVSAATPTFTDDDGNVYGVVSQQPTALGTWTAVSKLILPAGTYYVSVEGTGRQLTYLDGTDELWQIAQRDPDKTRPMPDSSIHPGPIKRYGTTPGYYKTVVDPDTGESSEEFFEVKLPDDNSDYGYSNYGSLGYYSITGTIHKSLVVGVDFDEVDGLGPQNWTLYAGGDTDRTIKNLVSEAGYVTPYQLTIQTTGASPIQTVVSSNPIDPAEVPYHGLPLDAVDGYISAQDQTLKFIWGNLAPSTVYQVFVFGHAGVEAKNNIHVVGGQWNGAQQIFDFTQDVTADGLVTNGNTPGTDDLSTYSLLVISNAQGEITITVTNETGFIAAIAGVAIAPTKVGSIEGQVWNDVNGDRVLDATETGLPNWIVYLDVNNDGILNSTSDQDITVSSPDIPQTISDYTTVKSELEFNEVGTIADIDVAFDITHSYDSDVQVYLISPSGTRVLLVEDATPENPDGINFTNTVFDDAAPTSILTGTGPFTGRYRPIEPLSILNGEDAFGTWNLEIFDDGTADEGVLNGWTITVKLEGVFLEPFQVTDANGNYTFTDLPAGQYLVREHMTDEQIEEGWRPTFAPSPVTVRSGANVTSIDFGNWIPTSQHGSIAGQAFNDIDGDGVKDPGEAGLPNWIVYIDSDNDGTRDLGTAPVTINAPDLPKAITDFATTTSSLSFNDLGTVFSVRVTMNVTHSFVEDLDAYLISPSGRQVELFTAVGSQYNDLNNITLDDAASRSISTLSLDDHLSTGFTGTWRPEGLLSDFIGESSTGIWTLLIRDNAFGDQGMLNSWTLEIKSGEAFQTTDADGNYAFNDLTPGQYIVREEAKPGWAQVPPATTDIPGAVFGGSQWTVTVVGIDTPSDPIPDSKRNVKNVDFGSDSLAIAGDYNQDSSVDNGDFIVFRRTFGTTVPSFSGADGDGDGTVDQGDYDVWRAHFGQTNLGSGSGQSLAVEAPTSSGVTTTFAAASVATAASAPVEDVATLSGEDGSSSLAVGSAASFVTYSDRITSSERGQLIGSSTSAVSSSSDAALLAWLTSSSLSPRERANDAAADLQVASDVDSDELQSLDAVFESLAVGAL